MVSSQHHSRPKGWPTMAMSTCGPISQRMWAATGTKRRGYERTGMHLRDGLLSFSLCAATVVVFGVALVVAVVLGRQALRGRRRGLCQPRAVVHDASGHSIPEDETIQYNGCWDAVPQRSCDRLAAGWVGGSMGMGRGDSGQWTAGEILSQIVSTGASTRPVQTGSTV